MSNDARAELERELGIELAVLDKLDAEEIADLLTLFRAARAEEEAALEKAVDQTVGALPWPIRGPAKKIMFGGRRK